MLIEFPISYLSEYFFSECLQRNALWQNPRYVFRHYILMQSLWLSKILKFINREAKKGRQQFKVSKDFCCIKLKCEIAPYICVFSEFFLRVAFHYENLMSFRVWFYWEAVDSFLSQTIRREWYRGLYSNIFIILFAVRFYLVSILYFC